MAIIPTSEPTIFNVHRPKDNEENNDDDLEIVLPVALGVGTTLFTLIIFGGLCYCSKHYIQSDDNGYNLMV